MSTRRERFVAYALLIGMCALTLGPLIGMALLALHPVGAPVSGFQIPDGIHLESFGHAWETARFSTYLRSSLLFSIAICLATTFLSILSGYAFGTMRFLGSTAVFYLLVLGMIIPYEVLVIPLYYDLRELSLVDTPWAVILPQVAVNVGFGTFWMRASFRTFPPSLAEAASLDGATSWRTLWSVLVPPARPAIITLVLLTFVWSWNEFLLPLVMIQSEDLRTGPLGLAFFTGRFATDRVGLAAASVMLAGPIVLLFIALQRNFVRGVLLGASNE